MSKCKKELSEREKERLLIRRASGANASQLAHMEKMLQETKGLLEKKTETDSESKACGDTMGMYIFKFDACECEPGQNNVTAKSTFFVLDFIYSIYLKVISYIHK